MQQNRNIYQTAREGSGYTQEKAAELIGVSVESIRAYETDRRIPPTHIVIRMVDVYNVQHVDGDNVYLREDGANAYVVLKNNEPYAHLL